MLSTNFYYGPLLMFSQLILASKSTIRAKLLQQAGVIFTIVPARIDEDILRDSLQAEKRLPRDIADAIAEMKSQRVSAKRMEPFVLGCDQVLEQDGVLFSKSKTQNELWLQLLQLRGRKHTLYSAAVISQGSKTIWRFIGKAQLTMHDLSEEFLTTYVKNHWLDIQHCVGGYAIEAGGARLFSKIEGDYFTVLGLPLLEVLAFLTERGILQR